MGRRYFGGNSGYVGYSKSVRAVDAERRGLRSKSQMDSSFADEVNELLPENEKVTLKQIKSALSSIRADEWHHTSMYGNKTDYYSAETIADYFRENKGGIVENEQNYSEIYWEKCKDKLMEIENKYNVTIHIREARKPSIDLVISDNDNDNEIAKIHYKNANFPAVPYMVEVVAKNKKDEKYIGSTFTFSLQTKSNVGILMF